MRVSSWVLFLVNVIYCLLFVYLSVSDYLNEGILWWIWGGTGIIFGFSTFKRYKINKENGWKEKELILDQRTWMISKNSGYIAFIYLMIFLTFGLIAHYNGFLTIEPIIYMVLALLTGMLLFATLQIIQGYLLHGDNKK